MRDKIKHSKIIKYAYNKTKQTKTARVKELILFYHRTCKLLLRQNIIFLHVRANLHKTCRLTSVVWQGFAKLG